MKQLILGIILTGCGQSFAPQLFTEQQNETSTEIDAGSIIDAKADSTAIDRIDVDSHSLPDSIPDSDLPISCCRKEDFPQCEQCAEFSNSGTCSIEGMRCIFHGSGFVDYQICINSQWQWGDPINCR